MNRYERRNELIDSDSVNEISIDIIRDFIDRLVENHIAPEGYLTNLDHKEILDSAEICKLPYIAVLPELIIRSFISR